MDRLVWPLPPCALKWDIRKCHGGRAERGFDWLGVWFDATGPTEIAQNHRARRLRLEEQACGGDGRKRQYISGCNSARCDSVCMGREAVESGSA